MRDLKLKPQRGKTKIYAAETLKAANPNSYQYSSELEKLVTNSETREILYEIIENIISQTLKRDAIILAGDFNANTGSELENFKVQLAKFNKKFHE